ncbi:hypothetical protein [Nocardia seriolae]|uniref:hypothetical protein n=1 Tax=Nocardia seriolae TaxID=37332 RepID=UPI0018AD17DF|nr:hypothetical protein [Nocardia seriolae]
MTIDITVRKMTSDVSPEYAVRVSGGGVEEWRLSWLPRRRLSREQARAGMELDEVLSDPGAVYDEGAQARAAGHAARLGIGVDRAVILLAQRLAERMYPDPGAGRGGATELPVPVVVDPGYGSRAPAHGGARSRRLWG